MFAIMVISQLSLMLLLLSNFFAYLPTIAGVQLFDPGLIFFSSEFVGRAGAGATAQELGEHQRHYG